MRNNFSVYFFFCPAGPPEAAAYEHELLSLAEGLVALGVKCFGNSDFWRNPFRPEEGHLVCHDPSVTYHDCEIIVLSSVMIGYHGDRILPKDLFAGSRRYSIVVIDSADGFPTDSMKPPWIKADVFLKCQFNRLVKRFVSHALPWSFGLTNRIIDATQRAEADRRTATVSGAPRRDMKCVVNYRVAHAVRRSAEDLVHPILSQVMQIDQFTDSMDHSTESDGDYEFWKMTGRRHSLRYYRKLSNSLCCSCFGGFFVSDSAYSRGLLAKMRRFAETRLSLGVRRTICQFDSWRLWESFATGSAAVHVDLGYYGAVLPEMPVPGVHYVGVRFESLDDVLTMISNRTSLESIGATGREWALKHYSPVAVAGRFLSVIESHL